MSITRVAVIGAGAAGLAALRHLTARPDIFQAVAFEQTARVGGTWVYTDMVGNDENGLPIHSSMYKNMSTNLPKETMAFPGFPFPENLPSFMRHMDVLKYLEDYSAHYNLQKFIKFNTAVESVKCVKSSSEDVVTWEVGARSVKESKKSSLEVQQFDAIMVCNGHYSVPLIPNLPGLDLFQGTVMHSHNYRDPEVFRGKTVLCLGGGASGKDIVLDLEPMASKVYLSHRLDRTQCPLPDKVVEKDGIKEVTANSVILDNGEALTIDILLFCTGYHYLFPFLTEDCKLKITDERVLPLWKHLIHARYPSMSVIGVPKGINPFPLFDGQVRFVLGCLTGSVEVPSTEQMLGDIERDFEWRQSQGLPARYAHHMHSFQWDYNNELADLGGFPRLPKGVQNLYNHVSLSRKTNLMGYKEIEYKVTGPETFEELPSSKI